MQDGRIHILSVDIDIVILVHWCIMTDAKESYTQIMPTVLQEDDAIIRHGRDEVGGKAFNLAHLRRAGMPVPEFVVLPADAFDTFIKTGVIPQQLLAALEDYRNTREGRVAVRSSANIEDGDSLSMAGVFTSQYVDHHTSLEDAILTIYAQAQSQEVRDYLQMLGIDPQRVRMSVIVQELVESEQSGVMYSRVNGDKSLIQIVSGFGESLVDGTQEGDQIIVDASGSILKGHATDLADNHVSQLIHHAQSIETLFDGAPQDIEFAIADGTLYIVQARTQTVDFEDIETEPTVEDAIRIAQKTFHTLADKEKQDLKTSRAVFSRSNYSELLPHPTEMDFGVFAYIFTGADAPGAIQIGRNEMGYTLDNASVGNTKYVAGKPYFSLAGDALTYYAGFPETQEEYIATFVEEYLEKATIDPSLGEYAEIYLYLLNPTLKDLEDRFGVSERTSKMYKVYEQFQTGIAENAQTYRDQFYDKRLPQIEAFIRNHENSDVTKMTPEQLASHVNSILEHLRTVSCVDFVKSARLGFFYSKMLQTELNALCPTKEDADTAFARLSQGLDGSMITDANMHIADAPNDEAALEIAQKEIGHYSSEMLEIRHPRFHDDPQQLEEYVRGIRSGEYVQNFEKQKKERNAFLEELLAPLPAEEQQAFMHIVENAQTYMALRETVKYHFTREYALIRSALTELEKKSGLPEGAIFHIFPQELYAFAKDPQSMVSAIAMRKKIYTLNQQLNLPVVIREEDIDAIGATENEARAEGIITGKFLAHGAEILGGVIVNIDDYTDTEALSKICDSLDTSGESIILVAQQMNLTHDPFINRAAGIIIQNAGIVSHGAQRARELGRGALGGIATQSLQTGMRVNFSPARRTIECII